MFYTILYIWIECVSVCMCMFYLIYSFILFVFLAKTSVICYVFTYYFFHDLFTILYFK